MSSPAASWRDFMSPAELAAFDADPSNCGPASTEAYATRYENAHRDPRRSEREISLHSGIPAPEIDSDRLRYLRNCLELLDGLSELPASCDVCGARLKTDSSASRVTVVLHLRGKRNETLSFCPGCIDVPKAAAAEALSSQQLKVRQMMREGMTQADIAKALKVSQPTVSRMWNQSLM